MFFYWSWLEREERRSGPAQRYPESAERSADGRLLGKITTKG